MFLSVIPIPNLIIIAATVQFQMGQQYSDIDPNSDISSPTQQRLQKRFTINQHHVHSNSHHFKLLTQKQTNKRYVLRVIVTNDDYERTKLEELIYKKIANKNTLLTSLEQYIFEDEKSYCGKRSKCYLLFELGQAYSLKEMLARQSSLITFSQKQLLLGLQQLVRGLLWLKYLDMPHGNINVHNIYSRDRHFILSDPWIAPENYQNIQKYPSPQKLLKINNKIQDYDCWVSDVFSIAMCMLEVVRGTKMDKLYKKNHTINYEALIDEVGKCSFKQLKQMLEYLLLGNVENRKHYFDEIARKYAGDSSAVTNLQNGIKPSNEHLSNNFGIGIKRTIGRQMGKQKHKGITHKIIDFNKKDKPVLDTSLLQKQQQQGQIYSARPTTANSQNEPFIKINSESTFPMQQPSPLPYQIPRTNSANKYTFTTQHNIPSFQKFVSSTYSPISSPPLNSSNFQPQSITSHLFNPPSISFNSVNNSNYKPYSPALTQLNVIHPIDYLSSIKKNNTNYSKYQKPITLMSPITSTVPFSYNVNAVNGMNSRRQQPFMDRQELSIGYSKVPENTKIQEQKSISPVLIKLPSSEQYSHSNSNSNSSQNSQYINKINQNITNFQNAVHEVISNSISNFNPQSNTDNPNINTNNLNIDHNTTNLVVIENNENSDNFRFSQFRPSQIMTSNLDEEINKKLPNKQQSKQSVRKVSSEIVNQQDINLSQSKNNSNGQSLKQSHLILKDSLVEQIKNIHSDFVDESKAHYTIHAQNQDRVISSISQVNNSADTKDEEVSKSEAEEEFAGNPFKMHGTQLQILSNLTIPEQAPSEEESFEEGVNRQPKGDYREQQYQNGGKYTGYIHNGKRNGQGTFYYRDGGYYQGHWKDNMMNGYGKLYYDSGELAYEGHWYHDEFHGRGKVYNDSCELLSTPFNYKTFQNHQLYWKYYEGDLSHDMKEGHGKLMLVNGEYYVGEFRDDRPHGKGHFYAQGKVVHGLWNVGKLVREI